MVRGCRFGAVRFLEIIVKESVFTKRLKKVCSRVAIMMALKQFRGVYDASLSPALLLMYASLRVS